ncbi:RNA polymerase sigma factor [Flavivirga spongiicola]|uniref:RNA polymerase sigma-70 factor n=1 Tax=Flavivirga spongiicola TaxID=421621 RepID=A0ABU7XTX3_9FLAO|nr:RNA polymerase sigma-70 factor [Flavivirga sp. MEBiC05379]MDO5979021.1 RNA polymerase sigma-70 factor [Flavivirga sp. MEBiC05379]
MDYNELVPKIKQGDKKAFKIIFEAFYDSLVAYVTTFTNDQQEAKDIVQNCLIILWEKRSHLKDDSLIKNYLFKIAYHQYINHYKKKQYQDKVLDEIKQKTLNDYINAPDDGKNNTVNRLLHLIEGLPPKCKQVLLLNKKEGKKYKEIAELLGVSIKTVESQMRIAYQKIRKGFNDDELILVFSFMKHFMKAN